MKTKGFTVLLNKEADIETIWNSPWTCCSGFCIFWTSCCCEHFSLLTINVHWHWLCFYHCIQGLQTGEWIWECTYRWYTH